MREKPRIKIYFTDFWQPFDVSHTIPIYWGNPRAVEDFNPERFINCHSYASMQDVLDVVENLDKNQAQYVAMLEKPWFSGVMPRLPGNDPSFINFFCRIIDQGPEKARRTTRHGLSQQYYFQRRLSSAVAAPLVRISCQMLDIIYRLRGVLP